MNSISVKLLETAPSTRSDRGSAASSPIFRRADMVNVVIAVALLAVGVLGIVLIAVGLSA